jgi:hypothetical protein
MLSRGTKPQPQFTSMNVERSAHETSAACFRHCARVTGEYSMVNVRGSDLTALSDAQTISDDVEFPPASLLYASTLRFGAHTLAQMVGVW